MIRVIYQDKAIIVVEKPVGIQSQSTKGFGADMVGEIKKYLVAHGSERNPYVGVVHRLDQPVRGVMVYGLTKEATARLSGQISTKGHMDKEYLALVCGKPGENTGRLVDNLYFDRKKNVSLVVNGEEASEEIKKETKKAELTYEVMESFLGSEAEKLDLCPMAEKVFGKEIVRITQAGLLHESGQYSLLKVHLLTGRHHQIRLQLSNVGVPILGDTKYNPEMSGYRGQSSLCLLAWRIGFLHPLTGEKMSFCLEDGE